MYGTMRISFSFALRIDELRERCTLIIELQKKNLQGLVSKSKRELKKMAQLLEIRQDGNRVQLMTEMAKVILDPNHNLNREVIDQLIEEEEAEEEGNENMVEKN